MMESYTVTIANANTNFSLLGLVREANPNYIDHGDIVIQADDDGGVQVYRIGDELLDDTNYGQIMRAGDFSPHFKHLIGLYARCDTDAKTLNIFIDKSGTSR